MTVLMYVCLGLAAAVIAQSIVIVRVTRALQSFGRFGDRIAHLAAAMELLTDTTEAGLGNVAVGSSMAAAAKRITSAARRGGTIPEIAANELLSESEVRLHMTLAQPEGGTRGSLRS